MSLKKTKNVAVVAWGQEPKQKDILERLILASESAISLETITIKDVYNEHITMFIFRIFF